MKTAEEILKETLNLKREITEKDYWMTVKVEHCLKAINKALAISSVVGRSELYTCECNVCGKPFGDKLSLHEHYDDEHN